MSLYDTSGSTFYSETYPNPGIPSQTPDAQSMTQDTQSFANDSGELPQTINPVYTRYNDAGEDTFAPLPSPMDPSFQPATEQPQPVQTGFQFQPWMLLAAGAALVLWMRSEKE